MTIWTAIGGSLSPVLTYMSSITPKAPMLPVRLPKEMPIPRNTTASEINAIVDALDARKEDWVRVTCPERAQLLQDCMTTMVAQFTSLATVATDLKGSWGQGIGEEGNVVLANLFAIQDYYAAMIAGGAPKALKTTIRPNGQTVLQVSPMGTLGLLFPAWRGEVWLLPGQPATQGKIYREKAAGKFGPGAVSLVLGAGNQMGVLVCDILHKLFSEDEVVVLKMNPVNAALGPDLVASLSPLIKAGYVTFVYGGKEVAEQLIAHPKVTNVHLTGSADTYNSIVWGSPTAPRTGAPLVTKPVTAELGCISPHIVVPGTWTAAEMEYQAMNVVCGLAHNSGHNCLKVEVIVTAKDWPQREQFMTALKAALAATLQRKPWYPGSANKMAAFQKRFPKASMLGIPTKGPNGEAATVPFLLADGLSPADACVDIENWCGVIQEVCLPGTGTSAPAFMEAAEKFCNNKLWGTLSCCLICDPRVQKEHAVALDELVSRLRYGLIAINVSPIMGFCTTNLGWGAFPGHTPQDIGSGVGFVHNAALYDHLQKSVLWGSWFYFPKPFWWPSNSNLEATVPMALKFARWMHSSLWGMIYVNGIGGEAIKG